MNPDDLDASDRLLVKADALIQRHRASNTHDPDDDLPLLDDVIGEDLPVLDDVTARPRPKPQEAKPVITAERARIAELEAQLASQFEVLAHRTATYEAALSRATVAEEAARHAKASAQVSRMVVAEHLIDLDSRISQRLESWINEELPQLISSELESVVERIRVKAVAHMRATLVPELSSKLSEILDDTMTNLGPGA